MERSVSQYVIAQSSVCKQYESSGWHIMECDGMMWKRRNVSGFVTGAQQGQQQHLPDTSIALPAQLPPQTIMCPNCKWPGHTIDFCIAPGGKMEGLSMQDCYDLGHVSPPFLT